MLLFKLVFAFDFLLEPGWSNSAEHIWMAWQERIVATTTSHDIDIFKSDALRVLVI